MAERFPVLVSEADIAARIETLADELAVLIDDDWRVVQLMQGAGPFATDLMRALARRNLHPILDSLWLESYRDEHVSSGRVVVRADISRKIEGLKVLILDDVFDSGRTIAFAKAHLEAKGAIETRACAFIRKPAAGDAPIEHIGIDCPDRYLIGYGMDDAGRYRGLPYVGALD
ncbi:MAG: phosphoribosyltransferase family protein [Alphaproteobacteria bacterium]|mgnify:FL=1|nr:phosphoribosyltransferase family protein [Alphaproteobacteria bacterium]